MPVRKLNMFKQLRWSIRFSFIVFSLGYLILAMHLPVAIKIFATHDDALFWDHAQQIIKGNWLGSYNNLTLAKGVGFPLFLAMNAVLGIPVTLLLALFYLFACGLLAKTLIALKINKYYVLFIFVIILFHPALFPIQIIRDNIYPALSLIVISGVIRAILAPQPYDNTLRSVIPYGVALAWFWLTREEGIWMVPSIIVLLTLKLMQLKKQNLTFKPVLYRLCCLSVIAIALVNLVAGINYAYYGKFEAVDFTGSAYAKALKSLNSVDVGEDLPYIPVSFTKRQVIYKVSPAFRELQDYFEDKGNTFKDYGCSIYKWTCGDYAGGWFAWALRDAVANQGFYDNPVHAEAFYNNITQEINEACKLGLIKCQSNYIPLMPNISVAQWKQFPSKVVSAFNVAMLQSPVAETGGASFEPVDQLQSVREFLGNPRTMRSVSEANINSVSGWLYSTNDHWISFNCWIKGKEKISALGRLASQDIVEHFKDPKADFQRFSITVKGDKNCSLFVDAAPLSQYPIKLLSPGLIKLDFNGQTDLLYIESISNTRVNLVEKKAIDIKMTLATVYKKYMPYLVLLGGCVYLIYFLLWTVKRKSMTDVFFVSTMMWCLFLSRVVILILVDISSFPAIDPLYFSAAFPVLSLAAFCSLLLIDVSSLFSEFSRRYAACEKL